jgi:hypothetical protein
MRFSSLALVAFTALPAIACTESVDSSDVKTSGVYADMSVVASGNGNSEVSVGLKVGGSNSNTYLVMKNGDSLTAAVDPDTKTLSKSGDFYKTTFPVEAADTAFVIAFNRPNDTPAPNSTVSLPAPFDIGGIAAGDTVSRGTGFTATWTANLDGDQMHWTLDGDCFFRKDHAFADTGSAVFALADFQMHSGDETTTCPANLCVDRTRNGVLDPAYGEGGVIDSAQHRCVAFNSAP